MNNPDGEVRSVVVEREVPYPADKVWRALTQPHLIEEWLMKNDFEPVVDHSFSFRGNWGAVDCRVLVVERHKRLSYTWLARDLDSVVTWTLTPTDRGTRVRLEQSGFRPSQLQYYGGAKAGWPKQLAALEQTLSRSAGIAEVGVTDTASSASDQARAAAANPDGRQSLTESDLTS